MRMQNKRDKGTQFEKTENIVIRSRSKGTAGQG